MTDTYTHLVGSHEEFDLTLKYHVFTQWDAAITTLDKTKNMRSATEENRTHVWPKTWGDAIYFNLGNKREYQNSQASGWKQQAWIQDVYIDIFSNNVIDLGIYEREIDRIIGVIMPDSGVRIKKSDNVNNSSIALFDKPKVNWTRPPKIEKVSDDKYVHSSGIIGCVYFITVT
jgi:hypothetical protein